LLQPSAVVAAVISPVPRRSLPEHVFHKLTDSVLESLSDQFEGILEDSPAIQDFEVSLSVCPYARDYPSSPDDRMVC
jgi:hypothetical protein